MLLYTYLLCILWKTGESLIGLRPPSADPTYRRRHPLPSVVKPVHHPSVAVNQTVREIEKFILQRSSQNFVMTKEIFDKLIKASKSNETRILHNNLTANNEIKTACEPYHSLQCSMRFLKITIRGEFDECSNWKEAINCLCPHCMSTECNIKQTLNTIIEDLNCPLLQSTNIKGHSVGNSCCHEDLVKCTINAYLELRSQYTDCSSIERFTNCISNSTATLDSKDFERIFQLLLSLTKTCIYSIQT